LLLEVNSIEEIATAPRGPGPSSERRVNPVSRNRQHDANLRATSVPLIAAAGVALRKGLDVLCGAFGRDFHDA